MKFDIGPEHDNIIVKLKQMGDVTEVRYTTSNQGGKIEKISATEFIDKRTGEVKEFKHTAETRADNLTSISRSMRDL